MKKLQYVLLIALVLGNSLQISASESFSRSSDEMNQVGKRERELEIAPLSPTLKKGRIDEAEQNVHQAIDVATFLFELDEKETRSHSPINQLKLQKLLYYIQGYSLALNNCPMFTEEIVHYTYGPLIWEVWQHFKGRDDRLTVRDLPAGIKPTNFTDEEKKIIRTVFELKMLKTGSDLVSDTHKERPYTETLLNDSMPPALIKGAFLELDSWLPYVIQHFLEAKTNEDFENLVRYVREYLSYGCFDFPTLENILTRFDSCKSHLEKALACWTGIAQVRWSNQSHFDAFIAHLFFPVQYEYCYETPREESLHQLICISASRGNILAVCYALKLLELYSPDEDFLARDTFRLKILERLSAIAEQKDCPHYFAGLLCISLNKHKQANAFFRDGFASQKHSWCGYRYALSIRDACARAAAIEELKRMDTALALLAEVSFVEDPDRCVAINKELGKRGIPIGYYNAGMLLEQQQSSKALEMYTQAARHHIVSAFEKLAEACRKKADLDSLEAVCLSWGKAGDPVGFIKLGELLLEKGRRNDAMNCFKRAGIRGVEKLIEHADTYEAREKIKKQLIGYAESMYALVKSKIASIEGL